MPNVSVGLDTDPLAAPRGDGISVVRPYVKIQIAASVVPEAAFDDGRQYQFVAAVSPDGAESAINIGKPGAKDGVKTSGPVVVSAIRTSDSMEAQTASIKLALAGIVIDLTNKIRPMDRVRIAIVHPGHPDWLLFDGFVRTVRTSRRAGQGWGADVSISCSGLEYLMMHSVWNWQCYVHAADDVLQAKKDAVLADEMMEAADRPHDVARKFLVSAIHTAMSLRVGDVKAKEGIDVVDYLAFALKEPGQWASWPGAAYPQPKSLIQSASGQTLWQIATAVVEPNLHEFFISYRPVDPSALTPVLMPTLVHRPRPFPGLEKWDQYWLDLAKNARKIGGQHGGNVNGIDETLSADRHFNVFHWDGLGMGDNSTEAFNAKLFWGIAKSKALINRYGYASYPVTSKLRPDDHSTDEGEQERVLVNFAKDHLLHYAKQEIAMPFLRTRALDAVFLPVRPGEVVEDHSLGSDAGSIVTGYCTSVDFSLRASGDSVSMNMGAVMERCIRGVDAFGYPDALRALVPDVDLEPYVGEGLGTGSTPWPNQTAQEKSQALANGQQPSPPVDPKFVTQTIADAIKSASIREDIKVPAWLIAHILQNETATGTWYGSTAAEQALKKKDGIGQVTDPAVTQLMGMGHRNPDGSIFSQKDLLGDTNAIHAAAKYLKFCQNEIERMPGGYVSSGNGYYSWVARAYTEGPGSTRSAGASTGWQWTEALVASERAANVDFNRYWSPDGIKGAEALWGYLDKAAT